ncbi:CorA family divalent cation transporter [Clostridium vincentii]|uniref:Magnesium transport protein CorA n=1 Tax=Clostridium vincentii TaxID=52704 RepID=A0A2T0BB29_9CLOT|nr:CorA family divalent cation transporter [Clostridium vincentii]PRR81101.1 Magnesium transport protein CorA [Clostridium vincentii]
MIFYLKDNNLQKSDIENLILEKDKRFIAILSFKELESLADKLNINEKIQFDCLNGRGSKFESHDGFDYISLMVPSIEDPLNDPNRICIYFRENLLAFICDKKTIITDTIEDVLLGDQKCPNLGRVLDIFFDKLTVGDIYALENIEEEISELEESLVNFTDQDYFKQIMVLRKKLLKLKRYYEQFYNIAESVEENENGLIDKKSIKSFRIFTNRLNRLSQSVLNSRDYVSQVREAYQAQVDIDQNNIMKVFTVVTFIFLPLTLLVGWYGMNLKMPEFNWDYGYPFVIILSIIVVLLCVVFFKKKKWF